jgi:hypothetical protein
VSPTDRSLEAADCPVAPERELNRSGLGVPGISLLFRFYSRTCGRGRLTHIT